MSYKIGEKGFERHDIFLELCEIKESFSKILVELQQKAKNILSEGVDEQTKINLLVCVEVAERNSKENTKELKKLLKIHQTFCESLNERCEQRRPLRGRLFVYINQILKWKRKRARLVQDVNLLIQSRLNPSPTKE